MAHPNVVKAREDRNKAHADVAAQLTRVRHETGVLIAESGGKHRLPPSKYEGVERAVDDLKAALVHYSNACTAVEMFEES